MSHTATPDIVYNHVISGNKNYKIRTFLVSYGSVRLGLGLGKFFLVGCSRVH